MEHGQTYIIRRNESLHRMAGAGSKNKLPVDQVPLLGPVDEQGKRPATTYSYFATSSSQSSLHSTGLSLSSGAMNTIRFQVVVWYVGKLDVVEGRVPVTFRVTLFWNDSTNTAQSMRFGDDGESVDSLRSNSRSARWEMNGRQTAVQKETASDAAEAQSEISVPAISILNVVTFDVIGKPEVALLREDTGLFRWTAMYRATLIQEHWRVDDFPHDSHDISLKLAILAHRKNGEDWDRRFWKLALATENDSQGSTRVPHGLIVDNINIPEFSYDRKRGLKFNFESLNHGPAGDRGGLTGNDEQCLKVKLRVRRNSYYYDRNVVPLLGMLNFVAITITALGADEFFQRALLILNIAFVEISIRMSTDKHLPSVPYSVKLQTLLNEYFFGLLSLVLESNLVYELHRSGHGQYTGYIDGLAACTVFAHNAISLYRYYADAQQMGPQDGVEDPKPYMEYSNENP